MASGFQPLRLLGTPSTILAEPDKIVDAEHQRMFEAPKGQFYGFTEGTLLAMMKPADGQPATGGNGTMFAFKVDSPEEVDHHYAKAMSLGAKDDGVPGPRGDRGFYGSYFRDLDGNKLCIYHM